MNLTPDLVRSIALTIPCARCEAKVNERCTSISGAASGLHASRTEPIYSAYALGYAAGVVEAQGGGAEG